MRTVLNSRPTVDPMSKVVNETVSLRQGMIVSCACTHEAAS